MTTEQIELVKHSWKMFRGIDPAVVGDTFYSKLFLENPSLRKMFPKNMEMQYRKLLDMLNLIVTRLDRMEEINDEIVAMAKRHINYGVRPGHYRLVGSALLWTLKQGLGRDWNEDLNEAWTVCYAKLSGTMISAAYGA